MRHTIILIFLRNFVITQSRIYLEKEFSQSTDVARQHFKTIARLGIIYIYVNFSLKSTGLYFYARHPRCIIEWYNIV